MVLPELIKTRQAGKSEWSEWGVEAPDVLWLRWESLKVSEIVSNATPQHVHEAD